MSNVPQRIGKYELQQHIGSGSLGNVWKGHDLQNGQNVALKIFHADLLADPSFIAHFKQEGQALSALHHPNIVQIHDLDVVRIPENNSTVAYIAMDYIEGETLVNYIQNTSRKGFYPPVSAIVYLFKALGRALDYAHQQGVVHGSLKPSNILLDHEHALHSKIGEPRLADFGLSSLLKQNSSSGSSSNALYGSPEQAKNQPPTERSDIYSLGVILYEICTGVQPFRSDSAIAVMMQHINVLPTPPILINAHIPPGLSEVILRAIAKNPETRFRSASAMAAAVAEACSASSTGPISLSDEVAQGERAAQVSGPLMLGLNNNLMGQPAITKQLSAILPAVTAPYATPRQAAAPSFQTNTTRTATPNGEVRPSLNTTAAVLPSPQRRQRVPAAFLLASLVGLAVIILGAFLTVFWLTPKNTANKPSTQPGLAVGNAPGQVFFQDDALGRNDNLQITVHTISQAPAGKRYFVWLLENNQKTLPLGPLSLQGGQGTLAYPGNDQHTNLISLATGFLITLEPDGANPPSQPAGTKVYQGNIKSGALPALQHILFQMPSFPPNSGLATGLFETIKTINDKAGSIVNNVQGPNDYNLSWRQAIRIIDLIDNSTYAHTSGDLAAAIPNQLTVPRGILSSPAAPGYLETLTAEVGKLEQAIGSDQTQQPHLQTIKNALADLRDWIQKMRTYCVQLLKIPVANFGSPQAINLALQLKKIAADAYTGRTIPPNTGPLPILGSAGMYQAYVESQYLATVPLTKV